MHKQNLFSIGEVATAVGITRKTILNYESKGLITPDKKDGVTGNRYYTIDTFTQVRTIRIFQDLGLSLDEIHKYFCEDADLQPMISRLETMRDELTLTIEKLKERAERSDTITQINIKPQTIYCRRYNAETIADKTNLLRDTALEAMRLHGTDTTRRMYFTESSIDAPSEVSYCVAVPEGSQGDFVVTLPAQVALSFFHHGSYETIPDVRKNLIAYAKENGLTLTGTFRNIYLEGPPQHKDPSKFITQVLALLEE